MSTFVFTGSHETRSWQEQIHGSDRRIRWSKCRYGEILLNFLSSSRRESQISGMTSRHNFTLSDITLNIFVQLAWWGLTFCFSQASVDLDGLKASWFFNLALWKIHPLIWIVLYFYFRRWTYEFTFMKLQPVLKSLISLCFFTMSTNCLQFYLCLHLYPW